MQISHDFIAIKTSLIIVFNAAYRIGENEKRDVILAKCFQTFSGEKWRSLAAVSVAC